MDLSGQWCLYLIERTQFGDLIIEREKEQPYFFSPITQMFGAWVSRIYGPPKDRLVEDYAVKRNSYAN